MKKIEIKKDQIIVFISTVENANKNRSADARLLSKEELYKYRRFKKKTVANEYLVGKALTRKAISFLIGLEPSDLLFSKNKYDRPELIFPIIKNFDFNLSHSGGVVALVLSYENVGIDIEMTMPMDLSIYKKLFSREELAYIQNKPEMSAERFYKLWTLKEAYLKAIGTGLSKNMKSFYFTFQNNKIILNKKGKTTWFFKHYKVLEKYSLSICSRQKISKTIFIKNFI